MPLRVAAISFLNPAPLLYGFEHEPTASTLAPRYSLRYMHPAECARQIIAGEADLGLIPIASLTPELAIVPGCAIASRADVRSILLLVKAPHPTADDIGPNTAAITAALRSVRSIATDAASRSSQTYARILFELWHQTRPTFIEHPANPLAMLAAHDAALLIGDPALHAREHRAAIDAAIHAQTLATGEPATLLWLDLAALWREHTGLPWLAAVWAVRPEALTANNITSHQLTEDLIASRDAGLAHLEDLVAEWSPRTRLPPATVRAYLTHNIHYILDDACLRTLTLFRTLAAEIHALPPLPYPRLLS